LRLAEDAVGWVMGLVVATAADMVVVDKDILKQCRLMVHRQG